MEIVKEPLLAGFFKRALHHELNEIKERSEQLSDEEWTINDSNPDNDDKFDPKVEQAGLPSPDKLGNLDQTERRYISKLYKSLLGTQLTYNTCLKYAIPPQNIELEGPNDAKTYQRSGAISYGIERNKMYRPPKSFEYRGKEYYFNAFTGRYCSYMNYRCRDYKRCKGSIKLNTIDPMNNMEVLKGHSDR